MQAFSVLQGFVVSEAEVAATRVLVAAFGSGEDFTTQSAQLGAYVAALPASRRALVSYFDASTGAATHCEVGAWSVVAPRYYAFLQLVGNATRA